MPSITTVSPDAMLVAIVGVQPVNTISLSGFTEIFESIGSSVNTLIQSVAGASGSKTFTISNFGSEYGAMMLALRPIPVEDLKEWKYKCSLTIDYTKVGTSLSDFPVLLVHTGNASTSNLPDNLMITGNAQSSKSDGSDIRFTSDAEGNNEVPFEIVYFTQNATLSNVRAKIYVKLGSISSTVNTVFYMWWGNASASAYATTDVYGRNNVWTNNYRGVYHQNNSGVDSSNTLGNATVGGAVAVSADRFGASNASYEYTTNIANSYLILPQFGISSLNTLTISTWLRRNGNQSWTGICFARSGTPNATGFNFRDSTNQIGYHWNDTVETYNFQTNLTPINETWSFVSLRVSPTNAIIRLNDTEVTNTFNHETFNFNTAVFNIARDQHTDTRIFNGRVSDLRISTVTRASGWVSTEYNSESSPQTFIVDGSIENVVPSKLFNVFLSSPSGNSRSFVYTDLRSNKFRTFRYR